MNGGSAETSIERDRAAQRRLGAIEVIPLLERDPEVVEGLGVVRLLAGDSVEQLDGPCEVSLVHQRVARFSLPAAKDGCAAISV